MAEKSGVCTRADIVLVRVIGRWFRVDPSGSHSFCDCGPAHDAIRAYLARTGLKQGECRIFVCLGATVELDQGVWMRIGHRRGMPAQQLDKAASEKNSNADNVIRPGTQYIENGRHSELRVPIHRSRRTAQAHRCLDDQAQRPSEPTKRCRKSYPVLFFTASVQLEDPPSVTIETATHRGSCRSGSH